MIPLNIDTISQKLITCSEILKDNSANELEEKSKNIIPKL